MLDWRRKHNNKHKSKNDQPLQMVHFDPVQIGTLLKSKLLVPPKVGHFSLWTQNYVPTMTLEE